MCRNVKVVDWGPHDVPVALSRTWVVCVCDRCLCTLGMCRNVKVVDWGPHDVPVALSRTWVVCAVGLLRA